MYSMLYFAFQLNLREKTDSNNNIQLMQSHTGTTGVAGADDIAATTYNCCSHIQVQQVY